MIQSMTGYGRKEGTLGDKTFAVELKALNGKQLELQMKLPPVLRQHEISLRNLLQENLIRGSVDCFVTIKQNGSAKSVVLNTELIRAYYQDIKILGEELGVNTDAAFASIIRLPEVISANSDQLTDEEVEFFISLFKEAIEFLIEFRKTEGESLKKDLLQRIENIRKGEAEILKFEPGRMIRIKEEIQELLEANVGKENIDNNRMEQELIYYMEKIDIHEEQIRLEQHCKYFLEILHSDEVGKGKKLSFMIQEIGREINTTGSKAYDAEIQKAVVNMKDELEKAKEQILNVL